MLVSKNDILLLIREGRISFFFLVVTVFLLPVWRNLFIIALWPWLFFWFIEVVYNKHRIISTIREIDLKSYLLPAIFLLLVLSMFWSDNKQEGFNHLGRSVLLVIFPVVLGIDQHMLKSKQRIKLLCKSYIFGVLSALVFLLVFASFHSFSIDDSRLVFNPQVGDSDNAFFYSAFSFLIHPTYFGMMVLLATAISLAQIKPQNALSKSVVLPLILSLCFLLSLFLISSRAMMIAAILLIIWFLYYRIKRTRLLIYSLILVVTALMTITLLHPRLQRIRDLIVADSEVPTYVQILQLSGRGNLWQVSYDIIRDNPVFGVGIGDAGNELTKRYNEWGFMDESEKKFNCHNQFLEIWITTGVFGFLLLTFTLFVPLFGSKGKPKYLYGAFLIICMFGFLFESVLNRLWGVAFFSIFYSLLAPSGSDYDLFEDKKAITFLR